MEWEVEEQNVFNGEGIFSHKRNVHCLNLSKGNKRLFLNLQIIDYGENYFTKQQQWYICMMTEGCEIFNGSLDEAKKKALTYLPKAIAEAHKIIANYTILNQLYTV